MDDLASDDNPEPSNVNESSPGPSAHMVGETDWQSSDLNSPATFSQPDPSFGSQLLLEPFDAAVLQRNTQPATFDGVFGRYHGPIAMPAATTQNVNMNYAQGFNAPFMPATMGTTGTFNYNAPLRGGLPGTANATQSYLQNHPLSGRALGDILAGYLANTVPRNAPFNPPRGVGNLNGLVIPEVPTMNVPARLTPRRSWARHGKPYQTLRPNLAVNSMAPEEQDSQMFQCEWEDNYECSPVRYGDPTMGVSARRTPGKVRSRIRMHPQFPHPSFSHPTGGATTPEIQALLWVRCEWDGGCGLRIRRKKSNFRRHIRAHIKGELAKIMNGVGGLTSDGRPKVLYTFDPDRHATFPEPGLGNMDVPSRVRMLMEKGKVWARCLWGVGRSCTQCRELTLQHLPRHVWQFHLGEEWEQGDFEGQ
ncbi:hypothetical protein AX15_001253 [Amanita polypyramis BW_CC]|nr:hypothetical protein AX15_001253 [Amanita polypyramis BW_CC]